MNDREIADYVAFACHLADLAGPTILPYFRQRIDVENKMAGRGYDPVTLADKAAERAIRDEIQRVHPGHAILGEEHGVKAGTDGLTWIIDPIDGTRAFIIGQLHWGVLIALNDGTRPVVGVMHQPYTGETLRRLAPRRRVPARIHDAARSKCANARGSKMRSYPPPIPRCSPAPANATRSARSLRRPG